MVRFLGQRIVPHRMDFEGTVVGGLSGVDWSPELGKCVLISDDRSGKSPARFYTAEIDFDGQRLRDVRFTATAPLRRPDGSDYPPYEPLEAAGVDPEEIRIDPVTGEYWWSQEGNRPKAGDESALVQPAIQRMDADGNYLGEIPLPQNYAFVPGAHVGPTRNLTVEAFAFGEQGNLFVTALEGALQQDGPPPSAERGALSRVTVHSRTGQVRAQYAYQQEPLFKPKPEDGQADHGVASLLVHPEDPGVLLMLERTFITGAGFRIRLFEAQTAGATDIQHVESLAGAEFVPLRKRLLLDFDTLGLPQVDNLEGVSWGPVLPSGERTLLLVSDDNFHPLEITQLILLAVPPHPMAEL